MSVVIATTAAIKKGKAVLDIVNKALGFINGLFDANKLSKADLRIYQALSLQTALKSNGNLHFVGSIKLDSALTYAEKNRLANVNRTIPIDVFHYNKETAKKSNDNWNIKFAKPELDANWPKIDFNKDFYFYKFSDNLVLFANEGVEVPIDAIEKFTEPTKNLTTAKVNDTAILGLLGATVITSL